MERTGFFFKHSLIGLIAVLVGFAISVVFFARATPPLEASDEARHMGWIIYRVLDRDWPPISVHEPTLARQEATQPPLYYLLGSLGVRGKDLVDTPACYRPRPEAPIGRADRPGCRNMFVPPAPGKSIPGTWRAVYQVRVFSILLGCITVLLTGLTALRLLPFQPERAALAAGLVAFNPMFLFVSSSVNNDNLVNMLLALFVWTAVRWAGRSWNIAGPLALGVIAGLAALAKNSGLLAWPSGLLFLYWHVRPAKQRWLGIGIFLVAAGAIGGGWYLHNFLHYGEWTLSGIHTALARNGRPVMDPWALLREGEGFVKSFWGVFGAFNIIFPEPIYYLLFLLTAAGVLLTGLAVWRHALYRATAFTLLAGLPILNLLAVGWWTSFLTGSQGRLLFPSLPAMALLVSLSWPFGTGYRSYGAITLVLGFLLVLSWFAAWELIPKSYL